MYGARRCVHRLRQGASLPELVVAVLIVAILLALSTSIVSVALRFAHNIEAQANAARVRTARSLPYRRAAIRSRAIGGQYIVILRDGSDPHQELQRLSGIHALDVVHVYVHAFKGFAARLAPSTVSALLTDPAVRYVEQDQTLVLARTSQDPTPRSLRRINAIPNDKQSETDADIAIIDTGVDLANEELNVFFRTGFGASSDAKDTDGHGTQVASVAASYEVGVAPGARIWALKVADGANGGAAANLIAALEFVIARASDIEVANIGVLCNASVAVNLAAANCVRAGVTVVAAAGNDKRDVRHVSPASEPGVITVAALTDTDGRLGGYGTRTLAGDADDTLASFSNYGPLVDFIAPGVGVDTIDLAGSAGKGTGTSFAAAQVTGLAARLQVGRWARGADLSPEGVVSALRSAVRERLPGRGRLTPYAVLNNGGNTAAAPAGTSTLPPASVLPIGFEPNMGQAAAEVQYLGRAKGYTALLTGHGAIICTPGVGAQRILFDQANPSTRMIAQGRLPGTVNYLIGNDPAKWAKRVAAFGQVVCDDIYPGIDVLYSSEYGRLRFDIFVAPGADPSPLRLSFADAAEVTVDRSGQLRVFAGSAGSMLLSPPMVYQDGLYGRELVRGRYVVVDSKQVGFEIGDYDRRRTLVIDPVLFSTYAGGSGDDGQGQDVTVDANGNIYVVGYTLSSDFPTTPGAFQTVNSGQDLFVRKLNPAGSALLYSTYIGGSGAEGTGFRQRIRVDANGNAYLAASSASADFPTTPGAFKTTNSGGQSDAVIVKLSPAGDSLLYSTYFGGNSFDQGHAIGIDSGGNAYMVGETGSNNLPTTPGVPQAIYGGGSSEAFICKLNATGTALLYATYLGGSGDDRGRYLAVDAAGNAYVGGQSSADFPITAGAFQTLNAGGTHDGFVTKLNPAGTSIVYSTFLGGSSTDHVRGIDVDAAGNVYVALRTDSSDFPVTPGAFKTTFNAGSDSAVLKLNAAGSALLYSTFLGGASADTPNDLTIDSAGNAYVIGGTFSTDFPVVNPTQTKNGGEEAFITMVNPTGSALLFSTFLGGSQLDRGEGIAVDASGAIIAVGFTFSNDFPTQSAIQAASGGGNDTFITKFGIGPPPAGVAISPSGGATAVAEGGTTDTYTVVLNTAPTANVTITLNPGTQVTVAPATLTFTPANWNTPQTVTVTAVDDTAVEGAHTGTITHTSASADASYNAVTIASVSVSITDNDSGGIGATLYALTANVNARLIRVDPVTAQGTVIAPVDPTMWGIGLSVYNNKLYTADQNSESIVEIDPSTGATLNSVNIGIANIFAEGSVEFRGDGIGFLMESTGFWEFDIKAPSSKFISPISVVTTFDGLAFNSAGVLYGLSQDGALATNPRLYTINETNGAVTLIGDTGIAPQSVGGLAFGPGNKLYAVVGSILYELNTTTGVGTQIGNIGVGQISGLAYVQGGGSAPAGVTMAQSGGSTTVTEGGATDTYTVVLNTAPTANVTITLNPGTQVTVAPATLTFTPANWNVAQTVTVTAVDDTAVEGAHTGTIAHTSASTDTNYSGIAIASVTVNITDNEASVGSLYAVTYNASQLITIDPTTGVGKVVGPLGAPEHLGLDFRGTKLYAYRATGDRLHELNPATGAIVIAIDIGISGAREGDIAFRGDGVGFLSDWATRNLHRFDVSGPSSTLIGNMGIPFDGLAFNSSGQLYGLREGGRELHIIDTTTANPTLVGNTGITAGYATAGLTFDAAGNLFAALSSGTAPDSDFYKLDPSTGNATLVGKVGIGGVAGLTFGSSSAIAGVMIVESGGSTLVTEGGASDTYTVALNTAPTANVTITLNPGTQITVAPATLTFTPANWNTPQTVTVTAVDDTAIESAHTGTISHTAASTDASYNGLAVASVIVTITDNDVGTSTLYGLAVPRNAWTLLRIDSGTAAATPLGISTGGAGLDFLGPDLYSTGTPGLVLSITKLNTTNGGIVGSVDVGLTTAGSAGSLAFRSDGIGFLTKKNPAELYEFDIVAKTSKLIGPMTKPFDGLAFNAGGVLYGLSGGASWELHTIDPKTGASTLVGNTGIGAGFTSGALTFDSNGVLYAAVGGTTDGSLYQVNPQTGVAAFIGSSVELVRVTGLAAAPPPPAGVTITQSGGSTAVTEGGASDTYTVALNTAPTANVTITLNPGTQVTVAPATLTFTPANWSTPQTVTVTAVDDTAIEGAHTGTISHTAASSDAGYNGIAIASVTANITDNDVLAPGVNVTQSGGSTAVAEGGATDTYAVALNSQPTANVTVTINPGTQVSVAPATLTFTAANWNTPQTVTVTAVNDAAVEGPHTGTITHTAASGDTSYNAITIASVTANITDNDFPGVTITQSGGSTAVTEGGAGDTYTVVLNSIPTANVTITVSPNAQVTATPATLTFTPANWNTAQTVTVAAVNDKLYEGPHTGVISHTAASTDAAYSGIAVASVTVAITDDDPVPPVDAGDTSDVATYMGVLSGSKTITGADTLRHKNGKFDDDWYAWRMGQTGTLTVTLGNLNVVASGPQAKSTFGDLQFRVYRVINGNLIQFASSQESGAKTLSIPVNAQERILVWVYGIYYTQAAYDLSVDVK